MPRPRTQGQPFKTAEEWDANLIIRARKAWRAGASVAECRAILGSALSNEGFRQRCAKHGMRWSKGSNHTGDSALMTMPMERL